MASNEEKEKHTPHIGNLAKSLASVPLTGTREGTSRQLTTSPFEKEKPGLAEKEEEKKTCPACIDRPYPRPSSGSLWRGHLSPSYM